MLGGESKYIPIRDISCFTRFPESQLMLIKAYFDGSGTWHDPHCTHMSLAGFSATKDKWDVFEPLWESVLINHNAPISKMGNPYWHSVEAFHLRNGFRSWDKKRVRALALDLFHVLNKMPPNSLFGYMGTVRKDDYELVKKENSALPSPNIICLNHCFSRILGFVEKIDSPHEPLLELFFDENEPFKPIIDGCLKKGIWWGKYIGSRLETGRMVNIYPLQFVDLLAWMLNRYHSYKEEEIEKEIIKDEAKKEKKIKWDELAPIFTLTIPMWHALYDEDNLRRSIDSTGHYDCHKVKETILGCDGRNRERGQFCGF